jgi:hypothetical protein
MRSVLRVEVEFVTWFHIVELVPAVHIHHRTVNALFIK